MKEAKTSNAEALHGSDNNNDYNDLRQVPLNCTSV
jgi:hypothetical protein